jgi:hypothetical protein
MSKGHSSDIAIMGENNVFIKFTVNSVRHGVFPKHECVCVSIYTGSDLGGGRGKRY